MAAAGQVRHGSECEPAQVAEGLAALASPWRLEIVRLLAHDELGAGALADPLGLSIANTSLHLGRRRRAGPAGSRRDGARIGIARADLGVPDRCRAAGLTTGAPPDTGRPPR